jgi:hypothetical protein
MVFQFFFCICLANSMTPLCYVSGIGKLSKLVGTLSFIKL